MPGGRYSVNDSHDNLGWFGWLPASASAEGTSLNTQDEAVEHLIPSPERNHPQDHSHLSDLQTRAPFQTSVTQNVGLLLPTHLRSNCSSRAGRGETNPQGRGHSTTASPLAGPWWRGCPGALRGCFPECIVASTLVGGFAEGGTTESRRPLMGYFLSTRCSTPLPKPTSCSPKGSLRDAEGAGPTCSVWTSTSITELANSTGGSLKGGREVMSVAAPWKQPSATHCDFWHEPHPLQPHWPLKTLHR